MFANFLQLVGFYNKFAIIHASREQCEYVCISVHAMYAHMWGWSVVTSLEADGVCRKQGVQDLRESKGPYLYHVFSDRCEINWN